MQRSLHHLCFSIISPSISFLSLFSPLPPLPPLPPQPLSSPSPESTMPPLSCVAGCFSKRSPPLLCVTNLISRKYSFHGSLSRTAKYPRRGKAASIIFFSIQTGDSGVEAWARDISLLLYVVCPWNEVAAADNYSFVSLSSQALSLLSKDFG